MAQSQELMDAVMDESIEAEATPEEVTEDVPEAEAGATDEVPEDDAAEDLEVAEAAEDEAEADPETDPEAETRADSADEPERSEEEAPEAESTYEPFSFRVDGRQVEVEGASLVEHEDAEGNPTQSIVIPRESWQRRVQPHLRHQTAIQERERELRQEIEDLKPENNEQVIRANALVQELEDILSSEEKLTSFLENFETRREALQLKVENQAKDAALKARERRETAQSEEQAQRQAAQQIQSDLPNVAEQGLQMVEQELDLSVPDEAKQEILDGIYANWSSYYFRATEEHAAQYPDVRVGQILRDDDRLLGDIQRLTRLVHVGSQRTKTTENARKKNEAALKPKKKAPPTVSSKGSPPPAGQTKDLSEQEWREEMGLN